MDMDLLSSYNELTSTNDQNSNTRSESTSGSLQSEWDNFEQSLECSRLQNSTDEPISEISKLEYSNGPSVGTSMVKLPLAKDVVVLKHDEEEEDESHLPPGVRKKNRCHSSSSSSSSEDEGANEQKKNDSDSDTSSCSDASPVRGGEKKVEAKDKDVRTSREDTLKGSSKKTKRSRSSSESRSRSRSPYKRRRKSDDRHSRRSRSRSRSRHHRIERRHESRRFPSKERRGSKERDHRHKQRERKRSRSRERRGSYREYRSNHRRRERSRSRERRNRSPSPRGAKVIKFGDKVIKAGASFGRPPPSKPMTFKEKMRQQLIKAIEEGEDVAQAFASKEGTIICTQTAGIQQVPAPKKPPVPLMANLVSCPAGLAPATITAAEAAMQSMLALQKETTEKTGVEIPKYYNPAAINPVKYAEQVQKRKLLWSKTKEKEVNSQWHATTLSSDHDDRSKEKFRKLMGIKSESSGDDGDKVSEELELKQKELFEKLDKEYQYARMATHTHRGVGLGFGASSFQTPNS